MTLRSLLLPAALLVTHLVAIFTARADGAFRAHRYESFRPLSLGDSSIVFAGNSITNMNEWREWYGNDPRIVNRGVSGAVTDELLDNLAPILQAHPAKLFVGIGTNDMALGTPPDTIAARIDTLVSRVERHSPSTRVYVQSVLPSSVGARSPRKAWLLNSLLQRVCARHPQATFVNLESILADIPSRGQASYDGLHLTAASYRRWTAAIEPYVGLACIVPAGLPNTPNPSLQGSPAMRSTYFAVLPLEASDILMIGGEMIHGAEWSEYLRDPRVKNRGIMWGWGDITLRDYLTQAYPLLGAGPGKQAPAAAFLYLGCMETYDSASLDAAGGYVGFTQAYAQVLDSLHSYAPMTQLYIMSLLPYDDGGPHAALIESANRSLSALASSRPYATYVDILTPLADPSRTPAVCRSEYMDTASYITGPGYRRIADTLAPIIRSVR